MKNLRVSNKLLVSFTVVILFSILVACLGMYGMAQINAADDTMYDSNLMAINYIGKIRAEYNIQRAAIRDLTLYHSQDESFQTALSDLRSSETTMNNLISLYQATIDTDDDQRLFDDFTKAYSSDFAALKSDVTKYGENDDSQGAQEILKSRGAAIQAVIRPALNSSMELNERMGKESVENNTALFSRMTTIEIVALVVAVVVAVALSFYISKLISKPLLFMKNVLYEMGARGRVDFTEEEYRQAGILAEAKDEAGQSIQMLINTGRRLEAVGKSMERIASGDLTEDLKLLSEADTLGNYMQKMMDNLNSMFNEINSATAQVSTGAKQIADGSQALAQGSTEQAASVQQLSSSIAEIAQKTKENADMAERAAALANAIKTNAEKGSMQMSEMMSAVKDINDASQSINKVISVIDDIAFQTNILALNAAVEAARAGQHGKGFAVVAEEVRNLAAKSAEAAKDTGSLIANSIEKAELGARIADDTAASLNEIVSGINESTVLVSDIAKSSDEQSAGISQINTGIDLVAQVVQQNSATSEQSAAASQQMSGQALILQELIERFKLKNAPNSRLAPHSFSSSSFSKPQPNFSNSPSQLANNNLYGKY